MKLLSATYIAAAPCGDWRWAEAAYGGIARLKKVVSVTLRFLDVWFNPPTGVEVGMSILRYARLFCPFCQDAQAKGVVTRPVHALGAGKDGVEHRDFVICEVVIFVASLFGAYFMESKNQAFHTWAVSTSLPNRNYKDGHERHIAPAMKPGGYGAPRGASMHPTPGSCTASRSNPDWISPTDSRLIGTLNGGAGHPFAAMRKLRVGRDTPIRLRPAPASLSCSVTSASRHRADLRIVQHVV